ncbi:hypothetical protein DM860_013736 [Cuscuta australis]|uniref:Uncharacterized protein n=1 Tax=Cuscuta australis TaxID=267555 RepID=A0A328DJC5_9ASTE|nr:hypothetical protein DM860_013736 [Cuscuta australis]
MKFMGYEEPLQIYGKVGFGLNRYIKFSMSKDIIMQISRCISSMEVCKEVGDSSLASCLIFKWWNRPKIFQILGGRLIKIMLGSKWNTLLLSSKGLN